MLGELLGKLLALFSALSKSKVPPLPPGLIDTIPGCDPTPQFVQGLADGIPPKDMMPTYNIPDLIEHLDFRSSIHETYYGHIIEERLSPYSGYGDANFQLWAIEGYQNAIHYLRQLAGI